MKYEMKHAREPDKKRKAPVKRKAIVITLGTIAAIAVIVLVILNFQVISVFISSKMDIFTDRLSAKTGEKDKETADAAEEIEAEDTGTEDNTAEELPEEELPEVTNDKEDDQSEDEESADKSIPAIKLEIYEAPFILRATMSTTTG